MQDGLELFGDFLVESLAARIRASAHSGAAGLERWAALLRADREEHLPAPTGLNLEPRQTVL